MEGEREGDPKVSERSLSPSSLAPSFITPIPPPSSPRPPPSPSSPLPVNIPLYSFVEDVNEKDEGAIDLTPALEEHEIIHGKDAIYSNEKMTWRDLYGLKVPSRSAMKKQGFSKSEIAQIPTRKWADAYADVIAEDLHIPRVTIRRKIKAFTRIYSNVSSRVVRRKMLLTSGEPVTIYIMCLRTSLSRGDKKDRKIIRRDEEEGKEGKSKEKGKGLPISMEGLTNQMLLVFSETSVVTIRQDDVKKMEKLRNEWGVPQDDPQEGHVSVVTTSSPNLSSMNAFDFVYLLIRTVLETYERPFIEDLHRLDHDLGRAMYATNRESRRLIERSTRIKRRTQVLVRVVTLQQNVIEKFLSLAEQESESSLDLIDSLYTLLELGSQLEDGAESLVDLHIMIKSHQANEITKILSFITAIFLPVTFMSGVYGMNFVVIPELNWHLGYMYAWLLFVGLIAISVLLFFVKGWL